MTRVSDVLGQKLGYDNHKNQILRFFANEFCIML